jgi:2-isopropylmalate synthase
MSDFRKIKIFDTTLRDGEQSPGFSMNTAEKVQVAKQLDKLGVDVIEAGFPVTSPDDFEAIQKISQVVEFAEVCALCRSVEKDILVGYESVKLAKKPKIHTFIATSPIHREFKLKMTKEQVLKKAIESVKLASSLTHGVVFSPEDGTRTEPEFLYEVLEAVITAGATVLNIPDTVGYSMPEEYADLIRNIRKHVRGIKRVGISTHCQNDLGMATANSLSGIYAGADEIQCTINGIGERGGNASLEEVVMAIKTRKDFYKAQTDINTKQIWASSKLITTITGVPVQPNKAIVGANSFAHESGIHQDGVLKNRETYEIMSPSDIGLDNNNLVLGKHSGRHALQNKLKELGFDLQEAELNKVFADFKNLADKKKNIYDEDLRLLLSGETKKEGGFSLVDLDINCGTKNTPTAKVELEKDGKIYTAQRDGDGPVDAVFGAINEILQIPNNLLEYSVNAVTAGIDAQATVSVKLESDGKIYNSTSSDTDIVVASAKAYLQALNQVK